MRLVVIVFGLAAMSAALVWAFLLFRKAYISHLVTKSIWQEFEVARKKAIFNEAMQESYSDGWKAGYEKALSDLNGRHDVNDVG